MICIDLLLGTVIKHLQRLYADGKAAGQTLFVHIVVGVPAGVVIVPWLNKKQMAKDLVRL